MKRTRLQLRLVCTGISILTSLLSGCQVLTTHLHGFHDHLRNHRCRAENAKPAEPVVMLGGDVHEPGKQTIPERGLTLAQALALAGGPRRLESVPRAASIDLSGVREKIDNCRVAIKRIQETIADFYQQRTPERENETISAVGALQMPQQLLNDKLGVMFAGTTTETHMRRIIEAEKDIKYAYRLFRVDGSPELYLQLTGSLTKYSAALDATEAEIGSLSGGIAVNTAQSGREFLLVALRRLDDPRLTHYFPHESVVAGAAAEIPLRDGDFIRVVPITETTLRKPRVRDGDAITVRGFVESPGLQDRAEAKTLDKLLDRIKTPGIDPNKMSIVLTRSTADGLGRDVFVLPYVDAGAAPFDTVPTMPIDIYDVVPTVRAPLILNAIVDSMVGQAISERIERRIPSGGAARAKLQSLQSKGGTRPALWSVLP